MLKRLALIPLRHARAACSEVIRELRFVGAARRMRGHDKLQLGSGPHPLPGWANIDLEGGGIRWDLTRPLPIKGGVRLVYSEHFIEHVTREQALAILSNCRAAMVPGGTIRLSTPDLAVLVRDYSEGRVVEMPHGGWFPETPCRMANEALHLWGHQFVYDEPELSSLLTEAGFHAVHRVKWRESEVPELRNLETRPDMRDLILEATA